MRIAIFSDTFPPQTNGVANFVWQSAKSLAELGHEVAVFTVFKKSRTNKKNLGGNPAVISLFSVPAFVYPDERLALSFFTSLKKLKKFNPDIIHTHTPFSAGWEAVALAKFLKIPIVGTHHTFYDHYLKHAKIDYQWAKKFSWKYTTGYYNRCDLVMTPSQSLAETLSAHGLKKPIAVMQNFIDTNLFRPAKNHEKSEAKKYFDIPAKSIVYMGRISYEKSIDQIVKSFALMLKKMPDLKLMLVGDGPEKKKLETLAIGLDIKNKIIFTGFLFGENLVKSLWANDVFLTASKSENMPLSILETMASGLPMVLVKEKGLAELVKENINGFFAKTDDPRDMARKTLDIISDENLAGKFSRASRLLALEYSKEKVCKSLENYYLQILKKR